MINVISLLLLFECKKVFPMKSCSRHGIGIVGIEYENENENEHEHGN